MATPKPAIMWPISIAPGAGASIPFNRGGAKTATIATGTYYTPAALAAAVQAALTAADGATTWTVTVSATGRFTIAASAAFVLSWGAGLAGEAQLLLGWPAGATGSATTQTATNQHQNAWYADDPVVDDSGERAAFERAQTKALSGRVKSTTHATRYRRTIALGYLPAWKVWLDEEGSHLNEALDRLLVSGWARFRWFPDQLDLATGSDYALDLDTAKGLPRNRLSHGAALYALTLQLCKYV